LENETLRSWGSKFNIKMAEVVITRSDLQRLKEKVKATPMSDHEARRRHLKALSDNRVSRWPNTLEANRKQKENWKIEKEERIEKERQEIDRREAELQKEMRLLTIQNANKVLYEQTDRMKLLKSRKLLAEVVQEREVQKLEKLQRRKGDVDLELQHHDEMVRQLRLAEDREAQALAKKKAKARAVQADQQEQLEEYKAKYIEGLLEEKAEGERVRARAEADFLEEQARLQESKAKARRVAEEMLRSNADLQARREAQLAAEKREQDDREAHLVEVERMKGARKALEVRRFEAGQERRQRLIDRATARLLAAESHEEARLAQAQLDLQAAEDAREAAKAAKAKRQQQLCADSREVQARLRRERAEARRLQDVAFAQRWREANERAEHEEALERLEGRRQNVAVRDDQLRHAAEKKQARAVERRAQRAADRRVLAASEEDARRFERLVEAEAAEMEAQGMPTKMVRKLVGHKGIDIQPAMGDRV